MSKKNLIEVENLEVIFNTTGGQLKAVSDINFSWSSTLPGREL